MIKPFFILLFIFISNIYAKERCLQYGVIPYKNASKIETDYKKWKRFIENRINRCIDINVKSSYGDIINMFKNDKLDFAFVGPFSYILTKKHTNVEPIVTGITSDGDASYKSLLIGTKEVANTLNIQKPLKSYEGMKAIKQKLKDHKQKWSIAFTDESSTSGYAVPNYYMKKVELDPKNYFKENLFVGTHDASQLVVAHNIIPLAFSAQMFYNQMIQDKTISNKNNIIIWESDQIPKSPIIVKENLSKKLKQELQSALLELPKEYFPKLGKTIGYIKTDKNNYKIVEQIDNFLKR